MTKIRLLALMQFFILLNALPSYGHPSLTAHENNSNTILWGLGGDTSGNAAHNHIAANNFGGAFEFSGFYNAAGCWDNKFYRHDLSGFFDKGHCFINESDSGNVVRYSLPSAMDTGAKDRLRDAFDAWSEIHTGLEFLEGSPADFTIEWKNISDSGEWVGASKTLRFDSSGHDWSYQKSKNGVPEDKWHFYTVALHEVGHVAGLAHVFGDRLMNGGGGSALIGAPTVDDGPHWDDVDVSSINGVKELYGHPLPTVGCAISINQVCENNSPRAIVTPTLAGYTMTNIDLDYQLSGSSNWYPIYDGAPTCPIYNQPSNFMNSIVNALVTTAAGYVTGCTVQVTPIWCGSGDPL